MFVTNWISTTKIQKISEITNFFRHYFLSRTEVVKTQTRITNQESSHTLLKERVPCYFVTEKSFLTISATDIVVLVCSKTPLLYLLTQKTAQKFGYVLGIYRCKILHECKATNYRCIIQIFNIYISILVCHFAPIGMTVFDGNQEIIPFSAFSFPKKYQ